jgi:hypothetical protein
MVWKFEVENEIGNVHRSCYEKPMCHSTDSRSFWNGFALRGRSVNIGLFRSGINKCVLGFRKVLHRATRNKSRTQTRDATSSSHRYTTYLVYLYLRPTDWELSTKRTFRMTQAGSSNVCSAFRIYLSRNSENAFKVSSKFDRFRNRFRFLGSVQNISRHSCMHYSFKLQMSILPRGIAIVVRCQPASSQS